MAVFHQMGYRSNNLLDLPEMSAYQGAIFSPINSTENEMQDEIVEARGSREGFEIIFDPQLYVPATSRGKLKRWSYFPKDVDTADITAKAWWGEINKALARSCLKVRADAVCSPALIPKVFEDKYYSLITDVGSSLARSMSENGVKTLQTVLVNLPDLTVKDRPFQIASIVSRTEADRVYLVLVGTLEPRRELVGVEEIAGAMRLIRALEQAGVRVLVGFCSSEVILWKMAKASDCASGKFFNLRRFTRQRFEEPKGKGGGQQPYWFEEGLLAFLRDGDLIRVRELGLLGEASNRNPFCREILSVFDEAIKGRVKRKAWLRLGWRQFLYWFADVEERLSRGVVTTQGLLREADSNWSKFDAAKVVMEERPNDGSWIRNWLNAVREYEKD